MHATLDEHGIERGGDVREFCRGINEQIVEYVGAAGTVNIVCECSHPGCFVNIRLPVSEFRLIVGGSLSYVVAPGHADDEHVMRRGRGYEVVLVSEVPRSAYDVLVERLPTRHEAPLQHPTVG